MSADHVLALIWRRSIRETLYAVCSYRMQFSEIYKPQQEVKFISRSKRRQWRWRWRWRELKTLARLFCLGLIWRQPTNLTWLQNGIQLDDRFWTLATSALENCRSSASTPSS